MRNSIYKIYSQVSKTISSLHPKSKFNSDANTEIEKKLEVKTYPRFRNFDLPHFQPPERNFDEVIKNRTSSRTASKRNITKNDLSYLLENSCSFKKLKTVCKPIASAGATYPIESYILISEKIENLLPGIYHYRPDIHKLELMLESELLDEDMKNIFVYKFSEQASISFFLTCIWDRITITYGEKGYKMANIEAGAIAHQIQLLSTNLNLNSTICSGIYEDTVEKILDIDGNTESVVVAVQIF